MTNILIWVVVIAVVLLIIGVGMRKTRMDKQSRSAVDTKSRSEPNEYIRTTMHMSSEEKSRYLDGLLAQEELESRMKRGRD